MAGSGGRRRGANELDVPYRLIGGIAVTLLVHAHGASALAPTRETADADMGVSLASSVTHGWSSR